MSRVFYRDFPKNYLIVEGKLRQTAREQKKRNSQKLKYRNKGAGSFCHNTCFTYLPRRMTDN